MSRTLFPVGDYEKEKIREIAERENLLVAHKPDSQDICFVPDGDYASFVETETGVKEKEGNFVRSGGKCSGNPQGDRTLHHWTEKRSRHRIWRTGVCGSDTAGY